jgi:hypothetical protein
MPLHYSDTARNLLKNWLKNEKANVSLKEMMASAKELIASYEENKEVSVKGQRHFYKTVLDALNQFYNQQIYQKKSWWKKVLYFFGWVPKEEKEAFSLMKNIKKTMGLVNESTDKSRLRTRLSFLYHQLKKEVVKQLNSSRIEIKARLRYLSHRILTDVCDVPNELEGDAFFNAFQSSIDDLNALKNEMPDLFPEAKVEVFIEQLQRCAQYQKMLVLHQTMLGSNYYDFSIERSASLISDQDSFTQELLLNQTFKVMDAIQQMDVNSQLLLSHGYRFNKGSECGGHAALFCVEKISNNSVVFRFINTGVGYIQMASQDTISNIVFNRSKKWPMKMTKPLDIHELGTSDLLKDLLAPQIIKFDDSKTALQAMLKPIKNLQRDGKLDDDPKHSMTPQVMGSCSQSCIDAWLGMQFNADEMCQFRIFRLKKCLLELNQLLASSSLDDKERRYCQIMRIAAYASLSQLQGDVVSEMEQLDCEKKGFVDQLHSSSVKPDKLAPDKIDSYCKMKVAIERVNKAFSKEKQQVIASHMPLAPVTVHQPKPGVFWGRTELNDAQKADNKLAKTLLAKNILEINARKDRKMCVKGLMDKIDFSQMSDEEKNRLFDLKAKKTAQGVYTYSDLSGSDLSGVISKGP